MSEQTICGAETRKGQPCKNTPKDGRNRCYLHGGNQPRGTDSPNYKHGLYSKYAASSLGDVLEELDGLDPEELTRVDNELKLLQALIMKSKAIEQGTGDLNDLDTISKVIQRLVKSKQRAVALRIEEERLIPADDIRVFLEWMGSLLRRRIGADEAEPIMQQLQNFRISEHQKN